MEVGHPPAAPSAHFDEVGIVVQPDALSSVDPGGVVERVPVDVLRVTVREVQEGRHRYAQHIALGSAEFVGVGVTVVVDGASNAGTGLDGSAGVIR